MSAASGQLLMNVPIMFIVPAEQFLGNACNSCNSSFYKLTVMTIGSISTQCVTTDVVFKLNVGVLRT